MNGKTFIAIMNDGYLNVGWDRCKVYEDLKVMRCFNCSGFNHKSAQCPMEAENHNSTACESNETSCINYVKAAANFNIDDLDVKHAAWDRNCPWYLK